MIHELDRQEVLETFRNRVLAALDETAREVFGELPHVELPRVGPGATDGDLPDLFRAVDAQANRVATRFFCRLT